MANTQDTKALIKAGLRSVAASFPIASSIAQAWNEYEAHAQSKRIEEFFEKFRSELEKVEERIRDVSDYIRNSEETASLIEQTIEKIRRESSESKRLSFANLLANVLASGPAIHFDDKLTFIETLDTLREPDVCILSTFRLGKTPEVRELENSTVLSSLPASKRLGKLVASLAKLHSRGLISETITDPEHKAWLSGATGWQEVWREKRFELLPYGSLFLRHVHTERI